MKKVLFNFFILISLFFIIQCNNKEDYKSSIIKKSNDKNIKKLLEYNIRINPSPSKKYFFIHTIDETQEGMDPILLNEDIKVNDFEFKKGEEFCWFVFDINKKEIIIKGEHPFVLSVFQWDEKRNYLILDQGTSQGRSLELYNLLLKEPKIINISCVSFGDKNKMLYFSQDNHYIAYHYNPGFMMMPKNAWLEIRIFDIKKNKIYILKPQSNDHALEIIKWESNNELLYKEVYGRVLEIIEIVDGEKLRTTTSDIKESEVMSYIIE